MGKTIRYSYRMDKNRYWDLCRCKYPEKGKHLYQNVYECNTCEKDIGFPYYYKGQTQLQKKKEKRDLYLSKKKTFGPKYKGGYNMNFSSKGKSYSWKKKHVYQTVECVICYNNVEEEECNKVHCKDTEHIVCSDCKTKISNHRNNSCPLCRTHKIRGPIYQRVHITKYDRSYRDTKKISPPIVCLPHGWIEAV